MVIHTIDDLAWTGPAALGHIAIEAEVVDLRTPLAAQLTAYWESKHRDNDLPAWGDMTLRELGPLLPYLLLADPVQSGWRFRLFGTQLAARFQVEWTGRRVSEVFVPETAAACDRLYDAIARRRAPIHTGGRYLGLGIAHRKYEAAHLPVIGRDGVTVWIFGGLFFDDDLHGGGDVSGPRA